MANTTTSANMSMPIPVVGVDPSPTWGTDLNSCLTIVDNHDHSSGSGVPITPAGLNINSDLTFANNNATNVKSLRLYTQSAALAGGSDLGCLYRTGLDLYFNDGSGNQVRITQSGGVAGSPGSIGSLSSPASANYVAANKNFVWQSGTSKAAAMDNGAVVIRETDVTSAKGVTLQSPTSLAADYSLTLPTALPAATSYVTVTSGGTLSTATFNTLATSAQSNSFSSSSGSVTAITNLSVSFTASGVRPVEIRCVSAGSLGNDSYFAVISTSANACIASIYFYEGSTLVSVQQFGGEGATATLFGVYLPVSGFSHVYSPSAGTYTYTAKVAVSNGTFSSNKVYLMVREL